MVTLRPLADADLGALFVWEQDPTAVRMAAFTHGDPTDRAAFDAHYARVRGNPENRLLALLDVEPTRPLFGRVAEHNAGSATVLERAGFVRVGSETSFAAGVGHDVLEHVYRLGS